MRVCIIGHGPSAKGKMLGRAIDAHDVVIRHVECDWQNPSDYGTRYDIGIFCPEPMFVALDAQWVPDQYWFYDPSGTQAPLKEFRGRRCQSLTKIVNPLINGRHFSRGVAAAIAAIKILEPEELSLVGFDAVMNGQFNENHHHPLLREMLMSRYKDMPNLDTHDWAKENRIIHELTEERKVCLTVL